MGAWHIAKVEENNIFCDEMESSLQLRPMAVTLLTTVTWMCADHNSHLKIGPYHKKKGKDCRTHWALFALEHPWNNNTFWDFGFLSKNARLVGTPGHEHRAWELYKAQWWGTISLRRNSRWTAVTSCFEQPTQALDANIGTSAPGGTFPFIISFKTFINWLRFVNSVTRVTAIGLNYHITRCLFSTMSVSVNKCEICAQWACLKSAPLWDQFGSCTNKQAWK